jgi:hypothetical protein
VLSIGCPGNLLCCRDVGCLVLVLSDVLDFGYCSFSPVDYCIWFFLSVLSVLLIEYGTLFRVLSAI